jgi:dimethylargininase
VRAAGQHGRYLELLRSHGWAIVDAPPLDDHPDGVFVEDTLVVVGGSIVLTRPGAISRRTEVASMESVIGDRGYQVARITGDATLDGGDVLVTERHVFVGMSTRTSRSGAEQLAPVARREGREVVHVPVTRCLHLKTAITELPDGTLIAAEELLDTRAVTDHGYRVLRTDEPAGANVLTLGATVAVSSHAPRTAHLLGSLGFDIEQPDISEFHKLEAGLTCLSVLIPGHPPNNG